jgi:hypothetical protein
VKTKIMLVLSLIILVGSASGYAQSSPPASINVNIDFPFTVAGKTLPAGDYSFTADNTGNVFRVQGQSKIGTLAPILTRLAGEMHTTPQDAHLVFDMAGGTFMLSEVWIPGQDGYLLLSTKGPHTHKVVNVKM